MSFKAFLKDTQARAGNARPPKMEFAGILRPNQDARQTLNYPFTLRTKLCTYRVALSEPLASQARALAYREVIVRGVFDFDSFSLAAEEICPVGTPSVKNVAIINNNNSYDRAFAPL